MILMMLISIFMFMFSVFILMNCMYMYMNLQVYVLEWDLMNFLGMKYSAMIYLDFMGLMFIWLVLLISSMVMIYMIEYMGGDEKIYRLMYLMVLFVISMCLMVLSPSILSILLGWDGLGLISFCLVIYYQGFLSFNSGMLTVLCNRVGDLGLLMLICFSSIYGSWNLMLYSMDFCMMFFMLMAMFTKSAQMPFSSWLPAAMMAPTPISSLVHSSTLVTAGVYLLIRYHELMSLNFMNLVLYISMFTMFMAGLIANFEFDLKKVIALSTLSQLGFMMTILSMGFEELAFFHLVVHALFKSMMFMCVGMFIHNMVNDQDIRNFGKVMNFMPLSGLMINIGFLSLSGFFFISGFYSKDLIIEYFMSFKFSVILMSKFYMSMIFTFSYSIRFLMWLYMNDLNFKFNYIFINESKLMNLCMMILCLCVIFGGVFMMNIIFKNNFVLLSEFDKIMILKMYVLGVYLGLNFYKNNMFKFYSLMYFFQYMYCLMSFYKISYVKIFKMIFYYELVVEKGFYEHAMGLNLYMLKYYFLNNFVIKKINLIILVNMYVMILIFLIYMN